MTLDTLPSSIFCTICTGLEEPLSCGFYFCLKLPTYYAHEIGTYHFLVRMGRELRLSIHRKNEERKKRARRLVQTYPVSIPLSVLRDIPIPATSEGLSLHVSLPLCAFLDGPVQSVQSLTTSSESRVIAKWFVFISVYAYTCMLL